VSDTGVAVLRVLERGAQFAHEIAAAMGATIHDVREALGELVWAGLVASDGFAGLRSTWAPSSHGRSTGSGGRWARLDEEPASPEPWRRRDDRDAALELYARTLLNRYGIVCRRLLTREPFPIAWRELLRVYRRLEARGEVRGGRFVTGVSGEQFALPEAVAMAREVRRRKSSGEVVTISAADPLNLCGILDGGDRIPAVASTSIVFRDGIHVPAVIEENVADAAHSA
jgi:ATP-dependent Lhr-like helicase